MQKKPRPRPQQGIKAKKPAKARLKNPFKKPDEKTDKQPFDAKKSPKNSPKAENINWQNQYSALESKHQFLMAEYANYKKNNMKLVQSIRKYEGQELIRQILSQVMDNFEKALNQEPKPQDIQNFKKGLLMIYNNLKQLLKQAGVKSYGEPGDRFDPALHSALDSVPHKNIPEECIIHVVSKAYFLHDKLLRPAEVIVSRGPESGEQDAGK